jgi:hypothetical protein
LGDVGEGGFGVMVQNLIEPDGLRLATDHYPTLANHSFTSCRPPFTPPASV